MSKSARMMSRKVRQTFRREQTKFWSHAIRPRRWWTPRWLYKLILGFVLKIDNDNA